MAGKKQNLEPMRRILNKVDLQKPTTFLDQVYLGCTQRECSPNKNLVDDRKMFESRISAEATEELPDPGNENAHVIAWSYDIAGHAKKFVEWYCELAFKKLSSCIKAPAPCLDDHPFKKRRAGIGGRIFKSLLSNRSEMPLVGAHRQT